MTAVLQFSVVTCEKIASLSFALAAGEIAVLQMASEEDKTTLMELVVGEKVPAEGSILFCGKPLEAAAPGTIGWVSASGGLIGNLKIWENVTLPLWYHGQRMPVATEETVQHWLAALGSDTREWTDFMASMPTRLESWERKLAGLLRGLVQAPSLLVIDAALFNDVEQAIARDWVTALETFVREAEERAVLVVSNGTTLLPWRITGVTQT